MLTAMQRAPAMSPVRHQLVTSSGYACKASNARQRERGQSTSDTYYGTTISYNVKHSSIE